MTQEQELKSLQLKKDSLRLSIEIVNTKIKDLKKRIKFINKSQNE
jgi:hypothetical protein